MQRSANRVSEARNKVTDMASLARVEHIKQLYLLETLRLIRVVVETSVREAGFIARLLRMGESQIPIGKWIAFSESNRQPNSRCLKCDI